MTSRNVTNDSESVAAYVRHKGRSNSLSAFGHCRQASIDATLRLAYMYRRLSPAVDESSNHNSAVQTPGHRQLESGDRTTPQPCHCPTEGTRSQLHHGNTWFNLLSHRCTIGSGRRRRRRHLHQQIRTSCHMHDLPAGEARSTCVDALLDPVCVLAEVRLSDCWNFDIFALQRRCSDQLLSSMGMHLFQTHDLFRKLKLDRTTVLATLKAIESAYWSHNPYHTALHAADVTQAMHCFLRQPKLYELLSPAEVLGSLLAALCHDADHPGVNQSYLERTNHFLVSLYNSTSVLERHHIRFGLSILHQSGLARCLSPDTWHTVHAYMVQLIQATDMAQQATYRSEFAKLVEAQAANRDYAFSSKDRILILQIALKCADISNPCRPWNICFEWAEHVCQEFFCQGDVERRRWSLVPADSMDRNQSSIPVIQVGFIKSLVTPLFTIWDEFFNTPLTKQVLLTLHSNYEKWLQLRHDEDAQKPCTKPVEDAFDCQKPLVEKQRRLNCTLLGLKTDQKRCTAPKDRTKYKQKKPVEMKPVSPVMEETNSSSAITPSLPSIASELGPLKPRNSPGLGENKEEATPVGNVQTTVLPQSFVITTSCLRRHSLPETQGAIRKTFSFSLGKRTNSPPSSVFLVDVRSPTVQLQIGLESSGTTARCPDSLLSTVASPDSRQRSGVATTDSVPTTSVNILHTLVEEIVSRHEIQEQELEQVEQLTAGRQLPACTAPNLVSLHQLLRQLSSTCTPSEIAPFPLPTTWHHMVKPFASGAGLTTHGLSVPGGCAGFEQRRNSAPVINH